MDRQADYSRDLKAARPEGQAAAVAVEVRGDSVSRIGKVSAIQTGKC